MNSYTNHLTNGLTYGFFWGKYRPAILKLMISSAEGPQQYKFSAHEVRTVNPKGGFTFSLKIHKGRAVNDIRTSLIAKDLLRVLQQSAKASELSESSIYELKLDKHFVLHVIKTDIEQVKTEIEQVKTDIEPEAPDNLQDIVAEPIEG